MTTPASGRQPQLHRAQRAALGERVRTLRTRRRWAIKELARLADVSKTHLHGLETGRCTEPSAWLVLRLARALGTTTEFLLLGEHDPGSLDPADHVHAALTHLQLAEERLRRPLPPER